MSIKRFDESCMEGGGVAPHANGEYVKYADHIASHAYDEAKERELFEPHITKIANEKNYYFMNDLLKRHAFDEGYLVTWVDMAWIGWKSCAKSRARSAE